LKNNFSFISITVLEIFSAIVILKPRLHDATCCQSGLTSGWMFVYTIQPVVQPVVSTTGLTTGCIA